MKKIAAGFIQFKMFSQNKLLARCSNYLLILILALFFIVELTTIERMGPGYDEVDDLNIATSYQAMPFKGSDWDPTQARLPMYLVHILASIFGYTLWAARFISILIAVVGLLGTYLCAKRLYGAKAGILACFLLAINPLYLEYAKNACTESGVLEATVNIFLCYVVIRLDRLKLSDVTWIAIISGLLISSKFTGIIQIPLGLTALLWIDKKKIFRSTVDQRLLPLGIAIILPLLILLFYIIIHPYLSSLIFNNFRPATTPLFFLSLMLWLTTLIILYVYRNANLSIWLSLYLVLILCLSTALLFPPPHFCNFSIISSFVHRVINASSLPPWPNKMKYLFLCFLFKPSPFLGLMLFVSNIFALGLARKHVRLFVPIASMGLWLIAIKKTDFLQIFHLLPLLPCASVVSAVLLCASSKKRPIMAYSLLSFCLIGTAADLYTSYPDFNLMGYKWLKKNIVSGYPPGYTPIGCSMMANIGFDGISQCLKYVNDQATGGEIVVSYFRYEAEHIYKHVIPDRKFILINGNKLENKDAYKTADFIISTIEVETLHELAPFHDDLKDDSMFFYDQTELQKNFNKVFTVERAYGLTIASVWQRKFTAD